MQTEEQPRNKRRKEARPQEILEAALELFVEKGFAAAKMEDIARAAGVTRGTPYLYFANKEEIFKSLITEMLLPKMELGESILSDYSGSTRELLIHLLKTWWTQMGEAHISALPRLIMAEAGNFPDVARLYHEVFVQRGLRLIRQILERGIASGEMRPMDIEMACHVVTAPIVMLMISCNSAVPKCVDVEEPERYIAAAIDILLNGVLVNGGTQDE